MNIEPHEESFFGVTNDGFMMFKEDTVYYEVESLDMKKQVEDTEICVDRVEALAVYMEHLRKYGNALIRKVITYSGATPSEMLGVDDVQSVMMRLLQAKELCKDLKNKPERFDGLTEAKDACASSYGLLEWIIHGKDLI